MDKQTKTLLMVGAGALALYFILRPKGTNAQTPSTQELPKIMCNDGQMVLDVSHSENAKFADPCRDNGGIFTSQPTTPDYIGHFGYEPDANSTGLVNEPLAEMRTRHNAPSTSMPIFAEASGFKKRNRNSFKKLKRGGR
jgi:hypothetical protein